MTARRTAALPQRTASVAPSETAAVDIAPRVVTRHPTAPPRVLMEPPRRAAGRTDNGTLARWITGVIVVGPIAALVFAVIQLWQHAVTPVDLALLGEMYLATAIGITTGFHRPLTHRAFRAPTWLRFLLLVLGSMAVQGSALTWASTHLEHHAKTDQPGDPHSPRHGFIHAHLGWMIDGFDANTEKYGPWLRQDPVVIFVSKTAWVWVLLSLAIPFAKGGWQGLLWGGVVRICLVHHVTWSVNSVCHIFGDRPFRTGDGSTNHWLVGLLAGGEGWHNNHHAFQRSAFHGLFWWQLDTSGLLIRLLERARLIRHVQRVPSALLTKRLHEARLPRPSGARWPKAAPSARRSMTSSSFPAA